MLDQRQAKRDVFVLDGTFGLVGRLDGIPELAPAPA